MTASLLSACLTLDAQADPEPQVNPAPADQLPPQPAETPEPEPITLTEIIDGDTIVTSEGTVRVIGIDTPETGQCGYLEATAAVAELFAIGDPVVLEFHEGQNDTDNYNRLLRYVETTDGVDLGFVLIDAGLAVARYDSHDGYPKHPREARYRSVQTATLDEHGDVVTVACALEAERIAAEQAEAERKAAEANKPVDEQPTAVPWYTKYRSCSQLKKNTVGDPKGPFNMNNPAEADIYNYFQFETGFSGDGDGDGLACE